MRSLAIFVFTVLLSVSAFGEGNLEIEVGVDFFTQYIWRGQTVTKDPVAQPWGTIKHKKDSVTVWGNLDLTNDNGNRYNVNELNFIFDRSDDIPEISWIGYSVGFIHYDFPNTSFEDTTEIYAGLNLKTYLHPYFKVYKDVDEAKGTYVHIGIEEELYCGFNLDAGYGWGDSTYNNSYWGVPGAGGNVFNIGLWTQSEYQDGWAFRPSINYIRLLDDRYGDTGRDDIVVGFSIIKKFK